MVYFPTEIIIKPDFQSGALTPSPSASPPPPPPPLSLPSFESPLLSLHLLGWMMYYPSASVRLSVPVGPVGFSLSRLELLYLKFQGGIKRFCPKMWLHLSSFFSSPTF